MLILNFLFGLLIVLALSKCIKLYQTRKRLGAAISKLPGPSESSVPLVDVALKVILFELAVNKQFDNFVLLYHQVYSICHLFLHTGMYRLWLGWKPVVVVFKPENIEPILVSTSVLNKADEYRVFEPWIGEGLVTSKRVKWHFRRKILTPAFHFRILNDFLPIINDEATKLVQKLSNKQKYSNCSFDLVPVIALCTLDTICETAMGININCQANEHSDYVRSLHKVGELALARVSRPWLWFDWVFYRTETGRLFTKARDCMHDFTRKVILERRNEWQQMLASRTIDIDGLNKKNNERMSFDDVVESSAFKKKNKRLAFLDLLLHQHLVEKNMSLEDIREEVDTFMFAGHDTTAMNISWALYMLGLYPQIQARVHEELDEIFDHHTSHKSGDQINCTDVLVAHMSQMKYLEMVIKETLRMWPSIPFVARQMTEDMRVGAQGEYLIPEGATCMIFTHALHHNPRIYPKPEIFDPQRFSPENVIGRHPFAYIPFSAGPRNCIGQKFAQMEVKIILAKVLLNYRVESCEPLDKLRLVGELVIRSTNGLHVKLTRRHENLTEFK